MPYRDRIDSTITQLRQLTQQPVQASWSYCLQDLPTHQALNVNHWQHWPTATLNDRQHLAWSKGEQVMWLGQQLMMPTTLNHYPIDGLTLRLSLIWWAVDAQVFVNGKCTQRGDLYDCTARVLLVHHVHPGEVISVALRLVSPGHDDGALVQSVLLYEKPEQGVHPVPEPGFVADELAVLTQYCETFAPERLAQVAQSTNNVRWETVGDRQLFDRSLAQCRQSLLPLSDWIKLRSIQLLGHAHLDLAWLWPISETWDVAQRTFESALNLQQEYPDLIFGHSTPMLYEWMEQHRPDVFSHIQSRIQQGQWEAIAGLWVEPELNIVGGESIARQVLYGQRYCHEKFGQISRVAWLPDTFGFCWQLPQILTQGGIDYFVTQKLRWNDTTEFPYQWFEWRSPNGTCLHSLMSAPIGTTIDPVQMATYACNWEQSTGQTTCLWLPGVGDHGGGPTRDMIELVHRWQQSPFFPTLGFNRAIAFLDNLKHTHQVPQLPCWSDELYLELHRGCYTAHADQKYWNRRCEALLYEAELWSSLATLAIGAPYPKHRIEVTWKTVLFNQFHDILPGSSIAEVYADVNPQWEEAAATSTAILHQALAAIASHIQCPLSSISSLHSTPETIPIIIFNPLNWPRTDVISIPIPTTHLACTEWSVQTASGTRVPCQYQLSTPHGPNLLIQPPPIPGIGYQLLWLIPSNISTPSNLSTFAVPSTCSATNITTDLFPDGAAISPPTHTPSDTSSTCSATTSSHPYQLENTLIQVTLDPTTGDIQDLVDKQGADGTTQGRHIFCGPGNQLLAFRDEGEYWDAWNIAPNYLDHPLPGSTLQSIQWINRGPVEQRIRVVRQLGRSLFTQEYVLQTHSPILWIENQVEWRDRHTLVKVAFPFSHSSDFATYDMPFGAIQRAIQSPNSVETAKWEVPGLSWADLTDCNQQYGVSILSDYKHGYSVTSSELRLSLLRGPIWPDPEADQGHHRFCYGIYPHTGRWQEAKTTHYSFALRHPLKAYILQDLQDLNALQGSLQVPPTEQIGLTEPEPQSSSNVELLPHKATLLDISGEHFIVSAVKQSETAANTWMIRGYECHGDAGVVQIKGTLFQSPDAIAPTTLLETSVETNLGTSAELTQRLTQPPVSRQPPYGQPLQPWNICTWAITR